MLPLNPLTLHAAVMASGLPGTDALHPGDAIVAAFQALDDAEIDQLNETDRKLFWECSVYLTFANTFGSGARAQECKDALEAAYPEYEFREPEPVPEPEAEGETNADD